MSYAVCSACASASVKRRPLPPPPLTALRAVVDDLAARAVLRRRRCPASYVLAWQAYLANRQHPLSARIVRGLCWEPTVATEPRFLAYLEAMQGHRTAQALCGLVWSCHMRWSTAFAASPVAQRVQQYVAAYAGDHGLAQRWCQAAEALLSPHGPGQLAADLVAQRLPISAWCHTWGLDEQTPYTRAVLRQAVRQCWQAMEDTPAFRAYLVEALVPWRGWTTEDFRTVLGTTVLHPVTNITPGMPDDLLRLILADARLGDPRLPAQQAHWQQMPAAARQRCVHWLSEADLRLFFTQVLPECKDQEERLRFWQRYVPRIVRSRPLLHAADLARVQSAWSHIPAPMRHHGALYGAASAMIIDLGEAVVIQVSEVSAPCYIYGKRNFAYLVADFWQAQPFQTADLLVATQAALVYHHHTWEKDMAETFALCDIHPTYREAS